MFEHGSEALAADLAFWYLGVQNPGYPIDQLGRLTLELSTKFRALAIMQLLTEADTDLFLHNLRRSGRTREHYLTRLAQAGMLDDHHQASGRYRPFLDALAANDIPLARRIAAASPAHFRAGHEYEDDYCYARLLACLIADPPAPKSEIDTLFQQFDAWLAGDPSPRLALCRALLARDQHAFNDAFEDLLVDFESAVDAARARGQHETDQVVAERQVSIEALAILRVAELRGLTTSSEYRYCPSLARLPMLRPFPAV